MSKPVTAKQPRMSAQEKRWEAEGALSTIMRAKQIEANKGLHARAMKVAAEQHAVLAKVVKTTTKRAPAKK